MSKKEPQWIGLKAKVAITFFCLVMSSCGFHLRGAVDIPQWLNDVFIINQTSNRNFEPSLKEHLDAYRVLVVPDALLAKYRLILISDSFQQNIVSVSSSTTPRQYQLIYSVWFKILDAKGKEVIPPSQVYVSRQITINSDRILGSNYEEAITKREMTRDAVIQILNQLSRK